MTSMPPMGAVEALFKAVQANEFRPSGEQLAASDSLIATTARAVQAFDSAEQMWDTMREMLGSIPAPAGATNYVTAAELATATAGATASSGTMPASGASAPAAAITTSRRLRRSSTARSRRSS